jgi:hypothetical protein
MESFEQDSATDATSERQSQKDPAGYGIENRPEPGSKPPSCFVCRRRKVKCDKKQPCENCSKMGTACIFPTTSKKRLLPPSPELLKTLQMLEKAVKALDPSMRQRLAEHTSESRGPQRATGVVQLNNPPSSDSRSETALSFIQNTKSADNEAAEPLAPLIRQSSASGGRLIRDQGKETYLKASFWDAFNSNVCLNICPQFRCYTDSE